MDYEIILLNVMFGTTKQNKPYTRIGYCMCSDNMIANNDNFIGVPEMQIFVNKDMRGTLDDKSIFKKFILKGELVDDYKNKLNKVYKPIALTDVKQNYDISLA